MLLELSFIYIAEFILFYIVGWVKSIKLKKKFVFLSFVALGLAYGIIAYHIVPPYEWDLYRHYVVLDITRKDGIKYLLKYSIYKNQYGSVLLFYLISLLPNNAFLQFIAIFIEYLILGYIVTDYLGDEIKSRDIFVIILLHFAMNNIALTVSGVRQTLAFAIISLGIYLDISKNKIISIPIYIFGVLVHPGSSGVIILRLFYELYKRYNKVIIILPFWSVIVTLLSGYMSESNIYLINYYGRMINVYTLGGLSGYADSRPVYALFIFFLIIVVYVLSEIYNKKILLDNSTKFFLCSLMFVIGAINSEQFLIRYSIFLSFNVYPIVRFNDKKYKENVVNIWDLVWIFFFVGLIAYQLVHVTSHNAKLV